MFARELTRKPSLVRNRNRRDRRAVIPYLERFEERRLMTVYTVLNNSDGDPGSLRDAINQSNGDTAQVNTIRFALPAGSLSISLQTNLPGITQPVIIDGLSQSGSNGTPIVELVGSVNATTGLDVKTGGVTIKGLVINRFTTAGIALGGAGGSLVQTSYIGTNLTGAAAAGNGVGISITSPNNTIGGTLAGNKNLISGNTTGILTSGSAATGNVIAGNFIGTSLDGKKAIANATGIYLASNQNRVGGTTSNERNIISGNSTGVYIYQSTNNRIIGNYIGTDLTGTAAIGISGGISLYNASNNTIGGTTAAERNIISGNSGGIYFFYYCQNNSVQGNYIGTDVTGLLPIPNKNYGIHVDAYNNSSNNNIIGGTDPGAGNVIAGNGGYGLQIASDGRVFGNRIGVNATGEALGNTGDGIVVAGANAIIGSTAEGAGNIISNNSRGIVIAGYNSTQVFGNTIEANKGTGILVQRAIQTTILNNSISGNLGLGIFLDTAAGSPAANNNIKPPFLSSVIDNGDGTRTVQGLVIGSPSTSGYRIQFFASAQYSAEGTTSGKKFLGEITVNTNASSRGTFSFTYPQDAGLPVISATITDPSGNTSQFSTRPPAPVNLMPGPLNLSQNGSITLKGADGTNPAIAYSNNAGINQLQVTLGVAHGTLKLPGTANLVVTGDGSGSVTIKGLLASINTALDGLIYTATPGYSGADALSMTSNNLAGVELGGNQTRTDTTSITITPLADSPSVTPATTTANTVTSSGLVITPGDATPSATYFKISNLSGGTLYKNDGTTVITAGAFITLAEGAAGLKFRPAINTVGSVTFSVQSATSASDAGVVGTAGAGTITVDQLTSTTTLAGPSGSMPVGTSANFTATVSPSTASGTVTFKEGSTVLGTVAIANGTATFNTTSLSVGAHAIVAEYSGDAITRTSTSSAFNVTVTKTASTTTLASIGSPVNKGASVTFTATVSPSTATGTVTFLDGSTVLGTGTLGNGLATFTTTALAIGSHSITARYEGDASNATSTSTAQSLTVQAIPTTLTLTGPSAPVTQGQSVTLSATVAPSTATGTVTFKEGSTTLGTGPLSGGVATFVTSSLTAGSHAITATYAGDANHGASGSTTFTVIVNTASKTNTSTTLGVIPSTITTGQAITFTAQVGTSGSGSPTGTVVFLDGATPIGTGTISNGSAIYTTSSLAIGSHSITAQYQGDTDFNASVSSPAQSLTVNKIATTITLEAPPTTIATGQSFSLRAQVSTGTGTVSFLDGTTVIATATLSGQIATATINSLTAGAHAISVRYEGDATHAGSASEAQTITVVTASPSTLPSTISLAPLGSAIVGNPVTFTATVSPSDATGLVSFLDGSTVIGTGTVQAGQATFTTSLLSIGTHSITARYEGNSAYDPSAVSSARSIVISAANPSPGETLTSTITRLDRSPNTSMFGAGITLTALVSATDSSIVDGGVARFVIDTILVGTAPVRRGAATLNLTNLAVGTHQVQAFFDGDTDFTSSASPSSIVIIEPAPTRTTLTVSPGTGASAGQLALVAHVAPGIPQPGSVATPQGVVQFFLGDLLLGNASLNQGGFATLVVATPVDPTVPTLRAVFIGDANYLSSPSQAINVPGPEAPIATSTTLQATITPSTPRGFYLARLRAVVTDANGVPLQTGFVTLSLSHRRKVRLQIRGGEASMYLFISKRQQWAASATYAGSAGLQASQSTTVRFRAITVPATTLGQVVPSASQAIRFRSRWR